MRVLVLGGTGFMGPHVVRRLHATGHEVIIFHTGEHEADLPREVRHVHHPSGGRPITGVPDELRELAPDVVLHMVPIGERDAQLVVEAFKGVAKRIVAVSSMDVYRVYGRLNGTEPGPPDPSVVTEESPLREKLYPYRSDPPRPAGDPRAWMDSYDKILVERAVMGEPALPGTVLRLPMVYGPGTQRDAEYVKRMADRRPAVILPESVAGWHGPRGYSENMAHAIALAVTDSRAAGRIYNVCEPETLPFGDWVRRMAEAAGWSGRIVVLPDDQVPEHLKSDSDMHHHWLVDDSRIRRELDYSEQVPPEEGLSRAVEWQLANPPTQIDPEQYNYEVEDAALAALGDREPPGF